MLTSLIRAVLHLDRRSLWTLSFSAVFLRNLLPAAISYARGQVYLPWPDTQVVPAIQYLRGELHSDFMTRSLAESPYINAAAVLSWLLPAERGLFLTTYGTLAAAFAGACCVAGIACLTLFTKVIVDACSDRSETLPTERFLTFIPALLAALYLLPRNLLSEALRGFPIARWGYPFSIALNPSGLSFLLATCALLVLLAIEAGAIAPNRSHRSWLFILAATCFTGSVVLHPVCPLYAIIISSFVPVICGLKRSYAVRWWLAASSMIGVWLIGVVSTVNAYPQAPIDDFELFRIYVVERHPHHFLPSLYLGETRAIAMLSCNAALLCGSAWAAWRTTRTVVIARLAAVTIALALAINVVQFGGVELAHIGPMIPLGITRMLGCFNFLCTSCLAATLRVLMQTGREIWLVELEPPGAGGSRAAMRAARKYTLPLAACICIASWAATFALGLRATASPPALTLSRALDQHGISKQAEFVLDDASAASLGRIRELGAMNVFSDDYFPLRNSDLVEWSQRVSSKLAFLDCLARSPSEPCALQTRRGAPIYLVTRARRGSGPPELSVRVRGGEYFVYSIRLLTLH
jgi:hypothetical protein